MENTSVIIAVSGLSFLMTVIWGEPFIRLLKAWRIGKIVRQDGPDQHIIKMGTPTMGGIMFMLPVTLLTILFNAVSIFGFNLLGRSVLLPVLTMWAFALLGMIDDWEGIRGPRRGLGMRASTKLIIQVIFAIGIAFALRDLLKVPQLYWFTWEEAINLGPFYIPIAVFIIVGMSNAVNFTDGLDGLAGLISVTAFAAFGMVALRSRPILPGEVLLLAGGCALWFLMVQRPSRHVIHGRYRLPGLGRHPRCGCSDDRSVAHHSRDRSHPRQRSFERCDSNYLFQIDQRKAVLQDGPPSSPFRTSGMERNAGRSTLLAGQSDLCHAGHSLNIGGVSK